MSASWSDILWFVLLGGMFFMMMRGGGCCGDHHHKKTPVEASKDGPNRKQPK